MKDILSRAKEINVVTETNKLSRVIIKSRTVFHTDLRHEHLMETDSEAQPPTESLQHKERHNRT